MTAHQTGLSLILFSGLLLCLPTIVQAQEFQRLEPPGYQAPTRTQWIAAGLDPDEYNTAVRYEVSVDAWKDMDTRRHNGIVAGWACISTALLGAAVGGTVYYAAGVDFQAHPEQEVTIIAAVAAGALLLTGLVLATHAPGPEEFRRAWYQKYARPTDQAGERPWLAAAPTGFTIRW